MKENETSITFHIDKDVLKDFEDAAKIKAAQIGFPLNRKQSMYLAIKEATDRWKKENPAK